jgi:aspartyl protease family protein
MTTDDSAQLIWLLLAIVLVGSSLIGRRIALGMALRMALVWVAIFAVGSALVYMNRERLFRWEQSRSAGTVEAAAGSADGMNAPSATVAVPIAQDGHFWVTANVNGRPVRFLIDSGASVTALSAATARDLGLAVDTGVPVIMQTANGPVTAYRSSLASLRLDAIRAHDLPVVVSDSFGEINVLGMNFLSKLKSWRVSGPTMTLEAG